jgi:phosphoribosylanthranilate isomerase
MKYKLKVCGMKYSGNIKDLAGLKPDYMGFIFYDKSKRYAGDELDPSVLKSLSGIMKIGVFVNHSVDEIVGANDKFHFDLVQLHGDENPEFCFKLKEKGFKIIKAFSVDDHFDFKVLQPYKACCKYFLFDTKGANYGGNGRNFNWNVLKNYDNEIPFFLSGGIDIRNAEEIKNLDGLNIHAIDINSCFETEPGLKDIKKINEFISNL